MDKEKNLILIGDSVFAEIAYEYFTYDSPYRVVAFSVEKKYMKRDALFGLPIVPFEEIAEHFAPASHSFFAANVYTQKNQLRTRLYQEAKAKGYAPASYISPHAFVWRNVQIGEHCFIFENNVVQPFVKIGNNVVLWSGNHIGHHSTIHDNCFFASHVVVSGGCQIGAYSFLGVNVTVANDLSIGSNCTIGAGALVIGDVGDNETVVGLWKKKRETEEQK